MKICESNYKFIEGINADLFQLALDVERFAFFDCAIAALKARQFLDAWVDCVIDAHHLTHPGSDQLDDRIKWLINADVLSSSMAERLSRFKSVLNQKIHSKTTMDVSEHVAKEVLDNIYVLGSHLFGQRLSCVSSFEINIPKFKAAQLGSYFGSVTSTTSYLSGVLDRLAGTKNTAEKKSLRNEISFLYSQLETCHSIDCFTIKYRIYKDIKLNLINRSELIHAARQVLNRLKHQASHTDHEIEFIYSTYVKLNLKEAFVFLEKLALAGCIYVIRLMQNHYANQKFDMENIAKYCQIGIDHKDPVSIAEHIIMNIINCLKDLINEKVNESEFEQNITVIKTYLSDLKAPSENVIMCCESLILCVSTNKNLTDSLRIKHLEKSMSLVPNLSPWTMIHLAYFFVIQYHAGIKYPEKLVNQIAAETMSWNQKYGSGVSNSEIRKLLPFQKKLAGY